MAKQRVPALLLSILIASPAAAPAGDCTQVIDQIGSDAQQLQADAQKMGMDFVRDEYLDPALKAAKSSLKSEMPGNSDVAKTEQAVRQVREAKQRLDAWQSKVKTWSSQLEAIQACAADSSCSLIDLLKQVNQEIRDFIAKIGTEGIAAGANRVSKAADLLQSYSSRLEGTALGSASAAASCMDERVAQQSGGNDPVDVSQAKPKSPPATKGGAPAGGSGSGASAGTAAAGAAHGHSAALVALLVVVPLAAAGAVVAGKVVSDAAAASTCVTASQLAAAAPGTISQTGPNTACTNYIPCGRKTSLAFAVCVDLTCDTARYYYATSDGNQFYCTTVSAGANFTFNSSLCNSAAGGVVSYCQAH